MVGGADAKMENGIMQASFDMGGVSLWGLAFSRDQAAKMVQSINGRPPGSGIRDPGSGIR